MLEIILIILKILGCLILALLCLLVLALCIVLFVPFQYTSEGYKNDEAYSVKAKLTYLWPVLSIKVLLPTEQSKVTTKIFGITRKSKPKKEKPEVKEKSAKKKSRKKRRKLSFIKDVEYYINLWQTDKELILDVLCTVINALVTILPKHMNARIVFGTGRADVTGFIYAVYCVLETYLPEGVVVTPLWIEKHLEGEYQLRGKIRLFPLVVAFIKIVSNQNVRILYKKLRRE